MRVVLDPEVVVAGIVAPHACEGRLLDLALTGAFTVLIDDRALAAYRRALTESDLDLPPGAVQQLVDYFAETGAPVTPAGPVVTIPHPLADLAIDGCADALVVTSTTAVPERLKRRLPLRTAASLLSSLPTEPFALASSPSR